MAAVTFINIKNIKSFTLFSDSLFFLIPNILISSCCQSDRPDFVQPTFCFERNGCFGLQWLGQNACSPRLINSIGVTLENTKATIRRKAPNQDGGFIRIQNRNRPKK
jgi:hypothetical protein